jgi:dephospho-CoA kinase
MAAKRIVIGLVGQVCAGKSTVAAAFEACGAQTFDADACVHRLYCRADTIAAVERMFGQAALDARGQVDRAALGKIVFGDPGALQRLVEQIVYPRTETEIQKAIAVFRASNAPALLLDAPTLFEAQRDCWCDRIVYVQAPLEFRREWARVRGWPEGEIERREARMSSDVHKRRRADCILENNGTRDDLKMKAQDLLERWTQ